MFRVSDFLDLFYANFTQKSVDGLPQIDWIALFFLKNGNQSGFGTKKLEEFLDSKYINSKIFECNKFYCGSDYEFRELSFSKETGF